MNKILIVYICLLNCLVSMKGQTHDYHIYNRQEGFPSTEMLSLVRDAYGRMWFSGINGAVTYYDGKQFRAFSDTSAHSILNAPIELKTAENDTTIVLWNMERGLSIIRNGKIKTYRSEEYPILQDILLPVSGFSEGRIWGINQKGVIFQFDHKTNNFIEIGQIPLNRERIVQFDYEKKTKTYSLFVEIGNYTHKILKGQLGGRWATLIQEDNRINPIHHIYCTRSGQTVIHNNYKIRRYDGQKWQEVQLPLT